MELPGLNMPATFFPQKTRQEEFFFQPLQLTFQIFISLGLFNVDLEGACCTLFLVHLRAGNISSGQNTGEEQH